MQYRLDSCLHSIFLWKGRQSAAEQTQQIDIKRRCALCYSMKRSDLSVKRFRRARNTKNQVGVDAFAHMQNVG